MGEPNGYVEFVASRGTQLFRMAYLLTGERYAAEDLAQITLGKLYSAWAKASRADNLVAYSRTVMIRSYLATRRKTRLEDVGEPHREPVAPGTDTTLRLTLFAALAELSREDRAVVVLRYWHDLSVEDTAALVRVSPGAVRTRSMRALSRLREHLGSDLSELTGGQL
ncbi:SigE family RNA polymerase sigma factor [Kribbella sandramycini]|uniref:RNA polymerase sigma-70 factor (Sigma-E family) n=1 Tax=Kribbella sandramycini TaxID=60450 RepID=A0A7Y4L447_9ACTN|nr:SigE family RNA polymerase sigma factor [Kribbella sandramycini]MBB6566244.1 RNA polymerase sigma-70 factor (sigma-E family) [Kribbella sandramycini]NOL43091.1 SigE family RNA polymerase sigma factor [Kribbella sandramycini]